jgi:hypothetical protein
MAKQNFKPKAKSTLPEKNSLDINRTTFGVTDPLPIQLTATEAIGKNKGGRPITKPESVRANFYISKRIKDMLHKGYKREDFDSQSEFLENILENYFKDKSYYIP